MGSDSPFGADDDENLLACREINGTGKRRDGLLVTDSRDGARCDAGGEQRGHAIGGKRESHVGNPRAARLFGRGNRRSTLPLWPIGQRLACLGLFAAIFAGAVLKTLFLLQHNGVAYFPRLRGVYDFMAVWL